MSDEPNYYDLKNDAREKFRNALEEMENPDEDKILEALGDAVSSVMPIDNRTLALILANRLELGFPTASCAAMEQEDIFGAIRMSIEEDLKDDLDDLYKEAIETLEDEEDDDED